jgi:hypothetical protein
VQLQGGGNKVAVRPPVAGSDPLERHEFQIVMAGRDSEMKPPA